MPRKINLGSLIGTVFLTGLIVSFLASDSELRDLFSNQDPHQIEALLGYLKLGLGFLALVSLLVVIFFLAARDRRETASRPDSGQDPPG